MCPREAAEILFKRFLMRMVGQKWPDCWGIVAPEGHKGFVKARKTILA
jgi:hypothetical protein